MEARTSTAEGEVEPAEEKPWAENSVEVQSAGEGKPIEEEGGLGRAEEGPL